MYLLLFFCFSWVFASANETNMLFHRLKIHGFLINKARFASHYDITAGDLFDEQKHKDSLKKITQAFHEEGYFNVTIQDQLTLDQSTGMVDVALTIARGSQFKIEAIKLISDLNPTLTQKITKQLDKGLRSLKYTKTLFDTQIKFLKEYLHKKGYLHVKITSVLQPNATSNQLTIELSLRAGARKNFVFFGNHYFTDTQLRDKIMLFGQAVLLVPVSLLAQELAENYKKEGFFDVIVTAEEDDDERAIFVIQEGTRTSITALVFEGVTAFEHNQITRDIFAPIIKQKFYDNDTIKQATDKLIALYHHLGFWQAHVTTLQTDNTNGSENSTLIVAIKEGDCCKVHGIEIEQFPELVTAEPFYSYCQSMVPKALSMHDVYAQKQWLSNYMHSKGFLHAQIHYNIVEKNDGAYLVWTINHTKPITFGKTILTGNSTIAADYILRELAYNENELWDKAKIQQTLDRLRKLNIFDSVALYPEHAGSLEECKPLVLKCIEGSPFEVRVRTGFQTVSKNLTLRGDATYKFGASLLWKNVTNRADCLRLDADITRFNGGAQLQYEIPWLYNYRIRTTLKAYSNFYEQPVYIGSKDILYKAVQQGTLASFTRTWCNYAFGLNCAVEWMEINNISQKLAQVINFEPRLVGKKIPYFFLEPNLLVDYLDDSLNPTYGTLSVVSLKAMFPFSVPGSKTGPNAFFFKMLAEQSFFFPLYKNIVGGIRLRLGHIFYDEFNTIMPPERFYLGGPYSVRGYEPDMAPPIGFYKDCNNNTCFVPIGGKSLVNLNLEARFPLYKAISGVIFQDAGALSTEKLLKGDVSDFVAATGAGLRYATPIGALRFDMGIKWKKRFENDSRVAWYLTFGQAF